MTFQTKQFHLRGIAVLTTCVLLAACGAGGGASTGVGAGIDTPATPSAPAPTTPPAPAPVTPPVTVPPSETFIVLTDTSSTGDTALGFVALTTSNLTTRGFAGTLDHDAGTISGANGLLIGSIDANRSLVTLPGGETAELSNPGSIANHALIFRTSGLSTDLFGVVGEYTNIDHIPATGSFVYEGTVILQADNGNATIALTGDATITAQFAGNGSVTTVFDSLNGTKNDGLGGGADVSDVGTVTIANATLSGAQFSGGVFSTTGDDLAYSGGGTQTHEGQLFGPDAQELGGVFGLDNSSELELSGVFIGAR